MYVYPRLLVFQETPNMWWKLVCEVGRTDKYSFISILACAQLPGRPLP